MSLLHRTVAVAALGVCLLGAAWSGHSGVFASQAPASEPAPVPATLATCDIYLLIDRLLETDTFAKPIKEREEALKASFTPVEEELGRVQSQLAVIRDELQRANPQDPAAQAKFADFETRHKDFDARVQAYNKRKSEDTTAFMAMVSAQFVQAYEQVHAVVGKIAREKGYTHVVAQKSGKLVAADPRRMVEEFLSRPMAIQPEGSDLTEAVRIAMNLPETSAAEAKAATESNMLDAIAPPAKPESK